MSKLDDRQIHIIIAFLLAAMTLVYKLVEIQLVNDEYKRLAQRTILDKQLVYPSRGLIYDRNNKLMCYNKPIYDLEAIYRNINPAMDTSLFVDLLDISKKEFRKRLNKNWSDRRYHKSLPFNFMDKIDPLVFGKFQEHLFAFPGFYPINRYIRAYPQASASHLLGYLSEVDNRTVALSEGYAPGDYLGVSGLEKYYENQLKGVKGVKFLLRDNVGREVSSFNSGQLDSIAIQGSDLYTSIDIKLQSYCEKLLQGKRGSIVAIDPGTGEVLTMASAPSYDPNDLNLDRDRSKAFVKLTDNKEQKPLLDRSISARYPPGSIFKPILSLIALQEGVITGNENVTCPGYYQYKSFKYGCHDHAPPTDIPTALMHSCNSYFFSMIRRLIEKEGFYNPEPGLETLNKYLYEFGLGNKLGIDLVHEIDGFVPTPDFYKYLYRSEGGTWYSTYIMSIGIGQGELELTTLQMANLAAIIANKGYYYTPHIARGFSDPKLKLEEKFTAKKKVSINPEHFEPVIEGMYKAISRGTGYKAYVPGLDICGKTGTSQNNQAGGKDHSVFYAFAPKDNPKIAIAVYVENAGFGGDIAAPIASLVIEKYLNGETPRKRLEESIQNIELIDKP